MCFAHNCKLEGSNLINLPLQHALNTLTCNINKQPATYILNHHYEKHKLRVPKML